MDTRQSQDAVVDDDERVVRSTSARRFADLFRRTLVQRLVLGACLAALALNLTTLRPLYGIDSSFRIGLSEAISNDLRFGHDIAWPYGPLGFLAGPTLLSRGQLLLALLYQLVTLTIVFATLADQLLRFGTRRWQAIAALVVLAIGASVVDNAQPEFVSLGLLTVLAAWRVRVAEGEPEITRPWLILAVGGAIAGLQMLVKFGPGAVLCAGVIWFAWTCQPRGRSILVAGTSMVVALLAGWLLAGQRLGDLGSWFAHSIDLSIGYQDAQAFGPDTKDLAAAGIILLVCAGAFVFGAVRWLQRVRRAAAWPLVILVAALWFATKQGLVRWDRWHVLGGLMMVAVLTVAIPWERRFRYVPLAVIVVAGLGATIADSERLTQSWKDRAVSLVVLASAGQHDEEVAQARAELRAVYALPAPVVAALEGRSVHAEPWDVGALWAEDLEWHPVPNFQSYSTYTSWMDELNADELAAADGPDAVLLNDLTVDARFDAWESPDARVALTCNFGAVASGDGWVALQRDANVCQEPQPLAEFTVSPGESVDVPEPADPTSLVVARFELPTDVLRDAVAAVARPFDFPYVYVDGTRHRLVRGTAEDAHLVRSPGSIDGRDLAHGEFSISTMSFDNIGGGDIVVRFEEIPLAG